MNPLELGHIHWVPRVKICAVILQICSECYGKNSFTALAPDPEFWLWDTCDRSETNPRLVFQKLSSIFPASFKRFFAAWQPAFALLQLPIKCCLVIFSRKFWSIRKATEWTLTKTCRPDLQCCESAPYCDHFYEQIQPNLCYSSLWEIPN